DKLRDFVIEGQFALFLQKKDCRGRELLADRTDAISHLWRGQRPGFNARIAVSLYINDLTVLYDRYRRARATALGQSFAHDLVDPLADIRRQLPLGNC